MSDYTPAFPGLAFPGLTFPGLAMLPTLPTVVAAPSPRALTDLLTGHHTRLARALILTGPAAGESLPVVAAQVTLTHDADIRLSGSVTVAAVEPWTVQDADAALDPRGGIELALAQGVQGDDGAQHWWPVGIVRPTRHTLTVTAERIEVTCDVHDRGGVIQHAAAPHALTIRAGTGILTGILNALGAVAPWLPVDLPIDEADVPAGSDIVLAERAGDDLWANARALTRDLGRTLTVNEHGTVVAPLRTAAQATDPIDVPMTGLAVEVDAEQAVHRIEAVWTQARPENADSDWEPASGNVIVADDDAIAALPENVPPTTRKYSGDESVLTTAALAEQAATAELADLQDMVVSGSCTTIAHPDATTGAVIEVESRRYRITQASFDLAGGPVDISLGNTARTLTVRLHEQKGHGRGGRERDETVTSLVPLMSRPLGVSDGIPLLVQPTHAVAGVQIGDVIRVTHDGAGRRTATGLLAAKTLGARYGVVSTADPGTSPADWDQAWGTQVRDLLLAIKAKHQA